MFFHSEEPKKETKIGFNWDDDEDTFENWDGGLYSWILHNKYKTESE